MASGYTYGDEPCDTRRDTGLPGSPPSTSAVLTDRLEGADVRDPMETDPTDLECEIKRLEDEIRVLSNSRKPRVRKFVHDELSADSEDVSVCKPDDRTWLNSALKFSPTRTSDTFKVGERSRSTPQTVDNVTVRRKNVKVDVNPLGSEIVDRSATPVSGDCEVPCSGPERTDDAGSARRTSTKATDKESGAADANNITKKPTGGKVTRKPLILEKYDGSNPLETFLAKFRNCSRYNGWSADEKAIFLRDSLTGNASQILWEISDDADDDEIIRLLRNRFGNSNQMERYRAELHGRRRRHGEPIQTVYQDIRRLGLPRSKWGVV